MEQGGVKKSLGIPERIITPHSYNYVDQEDDTDDIFDDIRERCKSKEETYFLEKLYDVLLREQDYLRVITFFLDKYKEPVLEIGRKLSNDIKKEPDEKSLQEALRINTTNTPV